LTTPSLKPQLLKIAGLMSSTHELLDKLKIKLKSAENRTDKVVMSNQEGRVQMKETLEEILAVLALVSLLGFFAYICWDDIMPAIYVAISWWKTFLVSAGISLVVASIWGNR
jgi:hypothetical protein